MKNFETELQDMVKLSNVFNLIGCRLQHAREKHPEGTEFENLVDEFLESWAENRNGNIQRTNDEILDLITCGIRILLGGDKQNGQF